MGLRCALLLLLALRTASYAGTVVLAWDAVSDTRVTGYALLRCLVVSPQTTCTPLDLPAAVLPATQTTYTDDGLVPATYVYAVVAIAPGLRSNPSNLLTVTVGMPPVTPPTGLMAVALVPASLLATRSDSEEILRENGRASNVVDQRPETLWHSRWSSAPPPLPHWLRLDLAQEWWLAGLRYLPRQDAHTNGTIAGYTIEVSRDGVTWQTVSTGVWPAAGKDWREVRWTPALAHSVRLWVLSEVNGSLTWASAAEVVLIQGQVP